MKNQALLNDTRVIEEIQRHQWLESEKMGQDIGFAKASEDWLTRYSDSWSKYNSPDKKKAVKSAKKGA